MDWVKILTESGGLGLAAFMAWRFARSLDQNTRVLERIHGFLAAHGMKDSDVMRKQEAS